MARNPSKANVSAPNPASGASADSSALPALIPLGHVAGKPPIPLHRPVMLIGSRSNAHIHLLSSHVSKAHALLVISEGNVHIRDLASRERVYVNGQELHDGMLKDGDLIKIGSFTFRLQLPSRGEARTSSAPGGALRVEAEDKTIGLDHRVVLIGRRSGSDITLVEDSVSTSHAVVVEMNGRRYVRDLGSRTGTFLNERQVHQEEIKFGDLIRVGETEMRYVAAVARRDLDEMEDLIGTAPLVDQDHDLDENLVPPDEPIDEPIDPATVAAIAASVESASPEATTADEGPIEIVVPVEPIAEKPAAAPESAEADVLELEPLPLADADAPEDSPTPPPVQVQAEQTIDALEPAVTVESPTAPAAPVEPVAADAPAGADDSEQAERLRSTPRGRKPRITPPKSKPKKERKPRRQKLEEQFIEAPADPVPVEPTTMNVEPAGDVLADIERESVAAAEAADPALPARGESEAEHILDLRADLDVTSVEAAGAGLLTDTQFAREVGEFTNGGDPVLEEIFEGEVVERIEPAAAETDGALDPSPEPAEPLVLDPEADLAAAQIETPPLETMSGLVASGLTLTGTPPISDDQWSATIAAPLDDELTPILHGEVVVSMAPPAAPPEQDASSQVYEMPALAPAPGATVDVSVDATDELTAPTAEIGSETIAPPELPEAESILDESVTPAQPTADADNFFGIGGQDFSFLGGIPLALNEIEHPENFGRVQVSFGDKQLRGPAASLPELPGGRQVLEREAQLGQQQDASASPTTPVDPPDDGVVTNEAGGPDTTPDGSISGGGPSPADAPATVSGEEIETASAERGVASGGRIDIPHPRSLSGRAPALPRLAIFDRDPFESPASPEAGDVVGDDDPEAESAQPEIPRSRGVFDGLALSMGAGTDAFSQTAAPADDPLLGRAKAAEPTEEIVIPAMRSPAQESSPAGEEERSGEQEDSGESADASLPREFRVARGLPDGFWTGASRSRGEGGAQLAESLEDSEDNRRDRGLPSALSGARPVSADAAGAPRGYEPHPRHRTLAKFQMLGVLMVLCMLGAGLGIYMWVPVSGTVTGTLRFANAQNNPGEWKTLESDQRTILKDAETRQIARAMSESDPRISADGGFLSAVEDFGRMADAARWETAQDGGRMMVISTASNDLKADSSRMVALLKAISGAPRNRDRERQFATLAGDYQFRGQRIDFLKDQIERKKAEIGPLQATAAGRPSDQVIAELDKAATEAATAWSEARAAAVQLRKQIEQIEASSPTTNPNDPGAAIDLAADTDLNGMSQKLDDLNRQLDDARQRKGTQADAARLALEGLTRQFQGKMQELGGAINESPPLRQYVSAAQELLTKTQELTEELIQAQRNQHEKIFEMKRRLDNKMAERKAELLARDEPLMTMKNDREMYKRRINAGESSVDPRVADEVKDAKQKLAALETQIRAREDEIGQDQLYTETIKQLDEYIRQDAEQLDKHRAMRTKLLETIQGVFDRSRPQVEKLPDDQKKLAGDLTRLMTKMDEQRTEITRKLDSETAAIENAQKRLEAQASALTTKLETRRADLLALRRRNLDEQQKTQLGQKREELAALSQKESDAQSQWITRSDRLKAQQQLVIEARYAAKALDEKLKSLKQDEQEQADKLREQPAKEAALQSVIYPIAPLEGNAHYTIDSDRRMIYLLGAMAGITAIFVTGLFVAARGGGGPGGPPEEPATPSANQEQAPEPQEPAIP